MSKKRGASMILNCLLVGLAILGIFTVLSGHKETFLNLSDIDQLSPGRYPETQVGGLLEPPFDTYQRRGGTFGPTKKVHFEKGKCGLSKHGVCSRCSFEKKVQLGNYAQMTNNDLYKISGNVNNGSTYPSNIDFYLPRKTQAPPKPLDIGNGLRVNKWHSLC